VYEQRAKSTVKSIVHATPGDRVLLALVFVGSILLPVIFLVTPLLSFADYALPFGMTICGTIVMVAALWLFWRSHADLGINWSVTLELREGHELVSRGVYKRVRHPMYAAIFLFCIAQGLLLENWLAGWMATATFACMYLVRAPREEAMMIAHFGESYTTYMRRTGRLLPWR
jgi:protein-S-isoprenylcysteine O-methyltransferase Ste14